jgi:hypothetical protein
VLHADVRPPNGALATAAAHSGMLREDVIGRVVGGGACVWVALCRRSNGKPTATSLIATHKALCNTLLDVTGRLNWFR